MADVFNFTLGSDRVYSLNVQRPKISNPAEGQGSGLEYLDPSEDAVTGPYLDDDGRTCIDVRVTPRRVGQLVRVALEPEPFPLDGLHWWWCGLDLKGMAEGEDVASWQEHRGGPVLKAPYADPGEIVYSGDSNPGVRFTDLGSIRFDSPGEGCLSACTIFIAGTGGAGVYIHTLGENDVEVYAQAQAMMGALIVLGSSGTSAAAYRFQNPSVGPVCVTAGRLSGDISKWLLTINGGGAIPQNIPGPVGELPMVVDSMVADVAGFDGAEVYEVLVYLRALSDEEMARATAGLLSRWGGVSWCLKDQAEDLPVMDGLIARLDGALLALAHDEGEGLALIADASPANILFSPYSHDEEAYPQLLDGALAFQDDDGSGLVREYGPGTLPELTVFTVEEDYSFIGPHVGFYNSSQSMEGQRNLIRVGNSVRGYDVSDTPKAVRCWVFSHTPASMLLRVNGIVPAQLYSSFVPLTPAASDWQYLRFYQGDESGRKLYDLLIYDRVLSVAEIQSIEQVLMAKHDL